MAPKSRPRFVRENLPSAFVELAKRRTEFLYHVMQWESVPMSNVLGSAYLQGVTDATQVMGEKPTVPAWHC